ncbi:hypothetical protein [Mesorhizobium koreense]|uniref:hypothetical protein n=1 Tax=Mesorhizobium koreense TaxID=3074855 RepID=UPI00287B7E93|nr:hypothetical protein [Mesorhizobium sp. WR6]
MPTFMVTEDEFKNIARLAKGKYEYNAKGFVLISFGTAFQNHVRIDLKKFEGGSFRKLGDRNAYMHLVSSFHIKRESWFSQEEQDYDYLYFVYAGAGVWQPIWGYGKTEKRSAAPTRRYESADETWSKCMEIARFFLEDLSSATHSEHQMAMGPVAGASSNLVSQL